MSREPIPPAPVPEDAPEAFRRLEDALELFPANVRLRVGLVHAYADRAEALLRSDDVEAGAPRSTTSLERARYHAAVALASAPADPAALDAAARTAVAPHSPDIAGGTGPERFEGPESGRTDPAGAPPTAAVADWRAATDLGSRFSRWYRARPPQHQQRIRLVLTVGPVILGLVLIQLLRLVSP